jgi:hypothetical protein
MLRVERMFFSSSTTSTRGRKLRVGLIIAGFASDGLIDQGGATGMPAATP